MEVLYLYGASGHAKVVVELAKLNDIRVAGLVDANPDIKDLMGLPVNGNFDFSKDHTWMITIGNNSIRKRIAEGNRRNYAILVHPGADISRTAVLGEGSAVMAGVSINADVQIGKHCIVNTNASVDHDCIIDDFVHISPNVALAGDVKVGEGTHIGIGACVIQGVKIGRWCTIGAGAVIIKDVSDGATVVGNPGRIIRTDKE